MFYAILKINEMNVMCKRSEITYKYDAFAFWVQIRKKKSHNRNGVVIVEENYTLFVKTFILNLAFYFQKYFYFEDASSHLHPYFRTVFSSLKY